MRLFVASRESVQNTQKKIHQKCLNLNIQKIRNDEDKESL